MIDILKMENWWPIYKDKEIEVQWSPNGKGKVRARKIDGEWIEGEGSTSYGAEFFGKDLIYEEVEK